MQRLVQQEREGLPVPRVRRGMDRGGLGEQLGARRVRAGIQESVHQAALPPLRRDVELGAPRPRLRGVHTCDVRAVGK